MLGGWLALDTGYLSPDRPTRPQWERLERAKLSTAGNLVYRSDFAVERPGKAAGPIASWGYYNDATDATVGFDDGGVTVNYAGVAWIGAALHLWRFEPGAIYRLTVEREVTGEPAAIIVRNRQMDLTRVAVPVGTGPVTVDFLAPQGSRDRVVVAFIPDNQQKPQGRLRITSVKIERLKE